MFLLSQAVPLATRLLCPLILTCTDANFLVAGSLTGISSSELASQSCVAPQISTMASSHATPQMSNNVTVMQRQRHGHRFCDEIDLNNPLCQNPPHSTNYQYPGIDTAAN